MATLWAMTRSDALRLARMRSATATGAARTQRLAARLSLSEVAEHCGVDQSTVWRWENGRRVPKGTPALKYARLLESLKVAP